ncbi:hypothetical protein TUM4438_20290 [Shewanella sairae]|uniref:Uncharacterized protein n=1 Tax=Shewanella sairae TaxID=190310 RepID=A0ABQ4PE75_9GAMM|nr:hypothetical protein TUM4438_20290 [Shewanella sairae]
MIRGIIGIIALTSTGAFASVKELKEYKCYVITDFGEQITLYRWPADRVKVNMSRLPMKKVPKSGPGVRPIIRDVVECVESDRDFSKPAGNELDRNLAR